MKLNNYESTIMLINEISRYGKEKGIVRLYTQDLQYNGRTITIDKINYINFGSCGYLGLEMDNRLKEASIDAILRYGTGFMSSRTYIACGLYEELEEYLYKIFNTNVIIYPKVSQGHLNVMPIIIGNKDIVIFDQQAHVSMQESTYKLKQNGTEITILRHNNMSDLENKIKEFRHKYNKIWYVIDGVYSMFGDSPNYSRINEFLNQYHQFYLYVDDAHGMSWEGIHGSGFALSHLSLNEKIVLAVSLAKSFGASGGAFIIKDKNMYDKVNAWGGAYTYAGPIEPATLGSAIASSKIHLTDEIYSLQNQLKEKIEFCYSLIYQKQLPVISTAHSPIFYIGLGTTSMGYNMVKRVMDDGYFTNLGIYPAVPESCTGLRFTLTNHITYSDIEGLVFSIAKNLPLAMKDENRSITDIIRSFKKYTDLEHLANSNEYRPNFSATEELKLEIYDSILQINMEEWDKVMAGRGAFTSFALTLYESAFTGNEAKQDNWKFIYYIVRNKGQIILATFFTISLGKDDMLSLEKVSNKIEKIRIDNPYYLTSYSLMMGSQISNGEHLYINYSNSLWKEALTKIISDVWLKQEKLNINLLLLRDFNPEQISLCNVINDLGFAKIEMPYNNIIFCKENNIENYIDTLNKKQRYNLRKDVFDEIQDFHMVNNLCNEKELKYCYEMYLQTKKQKFDINTFDLPFSFFEEANNNEHWEIIRIFFKTELEPVSMGICYHFNNEYCAVVYGMKQNENIPRSTYKKTLYFVIKHALELKCNIIHMGITAEETKHMFGATKIKQIAYAISKDNYSALLLKSMEN